MPTAPRPACATPRCPHHAEPRSRYCKSCQKTTRRSYDDRRGSAASRGYSYRWRTKVQPRQLRAQPLCEECLRRDPPRLTPATTVDHVIPVRLGGSMWDPENHQSMCASCHNRKTARETGFGEKRAGTEMPGITIVAGPPGSGKSTYVRAHKRWGDLVVDLDALIAAISGLEMYEKPDALVDFALVAQAAVVGRLHRPSGLRHAWIIATAPTREKREHLRRQFPAAEVIILETSPGDCLQRIRGDPRRQRRWELWEGLIRKWWDWYEPSERDEVIR